MKILFFDTETTGLPENYKASHTDVDNWPRLVQLAWIIADDKGKVYDKKNLIVKPNGFVIPEESSNVHGITMERAHLEGDDISKVLYLFNKAALSVNAIAGHNVNFDINVVDCELHRTPGFESRLYNMPKYCTMDASIDYVAIENRYGYKWPKLQELHVKCFGEEFDGAHDALADVSATKNCFYHLVKKDLIKLKY